MQINLYKTTKRKQRFVKWHLQVSFNQVSKNSSNLGTDWKCTAASTFGKKSISFRPGLMLDIHFMTVGWSHLLCCLWDLDFSACTAVRGLSQASFAYRPALSALTCLLVYCAISTPQQYTIHYSHLVAGLSILYSVGWGDCVSRCSRMRWEIRPGCIADLFYGCLLSLEWRVLFRLVRYSRRVQGFIPSVFSWDNWCGPDLGIRLGNYFSRNQIGQHFLHWPLKT